MLGATRFNVATRYGTWGDFCDMDFGSGRAHQVQGHWNSFAKVDRACKQTTSRQKRDEQPSA